MLTNQLVGHRVKLTRSQMILMAWPPPRRKLSLERTTKTGAFSPLVTFLNDELDFNPYSNHLERGMFPAMILDCTSMVVNERCTGSLLLYLQ